MDATLWKQVNDLLDQVLDLPDDARRAAIEEATDDARVQNEVRALLQAHAAADAEDALQSPFQSAPLPGTIGPWRPIHRLGVGGMGVVYAAEHTDPSFRQQAALKLVRPGFGEAFLRRFVRERSLLAEMEHPGVARLLGGGVTDDGLPYLAMELVDGQPITAYARAQNLRTRDRLALFLQACDAVAYAHQRLIVHRDLKPDHVLVTDGTAGRTQVKLLDFGVAKLLESTEEDEVLTRTGGAPHTPQYAAPEQLVGGAITTATDVYALGLILYELLTEHRAYDLRGLAPSDQMPLVTTTMPDRPSTRVGDTSLARTLRGDLDTIVLKAIAKEPGRRYASAEALAADIQRYLDGLPITARPDSVGYRVGKFCRRHLGGVTAASIALVAILGGAGAALWQASEARAEAARAEAVRDFLVEMVGSASPNEEGRDVRVADLLDRAVAQLDSAEEASRQDADIEAALRQSIGSTYRGLGLWDEAERQLEVALTLYEREHGPDHERVADAQAALGRMARQQGNYTRADSLHTRALAIARARYGARDARVATYIHQLGQVAYQAGDLERAEDLHREGLAIDEANEVTGEALALALGNLAVVVGDLGRYEEAAVLQERELALLKEANAGPGDIASAAQNLSALRADQGDLDNAIVAQIEALELVKEAFGDEHYKVVIGHINLGSMYVDAQDYAEAEQTLGEGLELGTRTLGADHPYLGYMQNHRARSLDGLGRYAEAEAAVRRALVIWGEAYPDDVLLLADGQSTLATILQHQGRLEEAEGLLRTALVAYEAELEEGSPSRLDAISRLGSVRAEQGHRAEGEQMMTEALEGIQEKYGPKHYRTERMQARLESLDA
ncbi:MAG: serine/threonine-protein kinase [Bacteroidota bacterium]